MLKYVISMLICASTFFDAQSSIKNIIFDLGGVILEGGPKYFAQTMLSNPKARNLNDAIKSQAWQKWNQGLVTKEELITGLADEHFNKQEIEQLLAEILSPQRLFIDECVTLISKLKAVGYRLFILSNFSRDAYEIFICHPFFKQFDGMMFSFQVACLKPEDRIYQLLLEQFSLLPEECIFIDDTQENVQAAQALGFNGILYKKSYLETELINHGIVL